jgi:tetratricopeptide (TPR) repeat protein
MFVVFCCGGVGSFLLPLIFSHPLIKSKKAKILIAQFDGPDPKNYRVTENVINQIRQRTDPYGDVEVISLDKAIAAQNGSEVAKQLGKENQSDIVIWGWYATTKKKVQVSVHFELLTKLDIFPKLNPASQGAVRTMDVSALENVEMQVDLAQEMTFLSLVTLAMVRYSAKDYDGAIARLNDSIHSSNRNSFVIRPSVIFFYRAMARYSKGELGLAIEDYNKIIVNEPSFFAAYLNRAGIFLSKGALDLAKTDFERVLQLDPNSGDAYFGLSIVNQAKGSFNKAFSSINSAIKINAKSSVYYTRRGNLFHSEGEYEKALNDYNESYSIDSKSHYNLASRGWNYFIKGDLQKSISDIDQAIEYQPSSISSFMKRGVVYSYKGESGKAVQDFKHAIQLAIFDLGEYRILIMKDKNVDVKYYEKAIPDFNKAMRFYSDKSSSYCLRGLIYFDVDVSLSELDFRRCFDLAVTDKDRFFASHGLNIISNNK